MQRSSLPSAIAAFLVAGLGSAILWQSTSGFRAITTEGARRLKVVEAHVQVPSALLSDMNGETISLADGKVRVVEFIYTSCPTTCLAAGDDFYRLRERLATTTASDQVQMLSISFDPERDDQDQLVSYAKAHGADGQIWTIARPSLMALPQLLEIFGITVIPDELGGYQHNIAAHVVDASGRLVRILESGDIQQTAETVEALVNEH